MVLTWRGSLSGYGAAAPIRIRTIGDKIEVLDTGKGELVGSFDTMREAMDAGDKAAGDMPEAEPQHAAAKAEAKHEPKHEPHKPAPKNTRR